MVSDEDKIKRLKKELKQLSGKDEIEMLKKKIKAKRKGASSKLKKIIRKAKTPPTIDHYIASLPQ